jgi:ribosomal protein L32
MVVRMRHTRSHTKNRRSHHALKGARLSEENGVKHPRHKALLDGTPYRGRSVVKKAPVKKAAGTEKKSTSKES